MKYIETCSLLFTVYLSLVQITSLQNLQALHFKLNLLLKFLLITLFYCLLIILILIIIEMEEGCFSSPKSSRTIEDNQLNEKIALGLKYPIYIITTSYYSPSLNELHKALQKENITLSFQSSLEKLEKIPMTHLHRFFIVLNDFKQTPELIGEFLKLSCQVAEYPKTPLQSLLSYYRAFVQKEQNAIPSKDEGIKQSEIVFLANQEEKQNASSVDTIASGGSRIQLRRISKMTHNYKSSFPVRLFVYNNSHDDEFFLNCYKLAQKYTNQNIKFITRIEEYLQFLPGKEDVRFLVMMSEYSALNLRKFFKKCDQIIVCAANPQNCLPLLRARVGQIICENKALDNMLISHFGVRQNKQNQQLKKTVQTEVNFKENKESRVKKPFTQQVFHQAKSSNVSLALSNQNLKISQQFSFVSQARKQLNLTSSIIDLAIAPTQVNPFIKNKIVSNNILLSPLKVEPESVCSTPLKIVQLDHIDLAECNNSFSQISVFTEVINTYVDSQSKGKGPNKQLSKAGLEMSNLMGQNDCQYLNQSQNSLNSRASQRSNRNSRIIERFRESGRKNSRI